jgi:uncharacterized membrane protein
MNNAFLFRIGVIIYALCIGYFGVNHLMHATEMAGIVPTYMPGGGKVWIYITGVCLILAAISFLIGKYTRIAALLLTAFLVIIILVVHVPNMHGGDMTMILKDSAMAAGALMIAGKG